MGRGTRIGFGIKAVVVGLALSFLMPVIVSAQAATPATQQALNLTTSPLPLLITTKPGVTVTSDIRVKNNSTKSEQLSISLKKFGASGEDGNPELQDRGPRDDYFDWVSFSDNTFTAEPGVWRTIHVTIKTPATAAFGYYYAVVFSRTSQEKLPNSSSVQGGVATLVLLDVETPNTKRQAELVQVTASQKVYEFLPATIDVKIHNTGNIHISPFGSVFIKRGNTVIDTVDFNKTNGNILPNSNRIFTVSWSKGFPFYEATKTSKGINHHLIWDFSKIQQIRFGRYTAHITAVYDNGDRDVPLDADVSFWVIPWRILGVILVILLFVGFGLFMILRSIWRKIRPRSKKGKGPKRSRGQKPGSPTAFKVPTAATPPAATPPVPPTAPRLPPRPVERPQPRPPRRIQF